MIKAESLTTAQLISANRACSSGNCHGCPLSSCTGSECIKLGLVSSERLAELEQLRDELDDLQADYCEICRWGDSQLQQMLSRVQAAEARPSVRLPEWATEGALTDSVRSLYALKDLILPAMQRSSTGRDVDRASIDKFTYTIDNAIGCCVLVLEAASERQDGGKTT